MIEQISDVIYAVTAGRTTWVTFLLVTGYTFNLDTEVAMASPEKALVDTLYLQSSKSPLFHRLPELEIPSKFDQKQAEEFTELIPHRAKRESTKMRLKLIMEKENHTS